MKGGPVVSWFRHHHHGQPSDDLYNIPTHVRMDLEVQRHDDVYHPGQSKIEATCGTARAGPETILRHL